MCPYARRSSVLWVSARQNPPVNRSVSIQHLTFGDLGWPPLKEGGVNLFASPRAHDYLHLSWTLFYANIRGGAEGGGVALDL